MNWEYKTVRIKIKSWFSGRIDEREVTTLFNELGKDGWEFVRTINVDILACTEIIVAVFKRPKN